MTGKTRFRQENPSYNRINPFRKEVGETLLEGNIRCTIGYLLRPNPIVISLDLSVLRAKYEGEQTKTRDHLGSHKDNKKVTNLRKDHA